LAQKKNFLHPGFARAVQCTPGSAYTADRPVLCRAHALW